MWLSREIPTSHICSFYWAEGDKHKGTQQCGCQGKYQLHTFVLSTGRRTVITKGHNSVAVKGNTNFTHFKSSKKTKSLVETAMFFVRLLRYNTARPPPAPDIGGKTLVTFRPKPCFTQKNEVDVCMHHMITNISCLVMS